MKQNRLSPRIKELVLGKPGLKIEIFKQMNWCLKYQRALTLSWLPYISKMPRNPVCAKSLPKAYML